MVLNKEWINSEVKEETKRYIETNKNENTTTYGTQKSSPKREIHSNIGLPLKIRKISDKQSNLTPRARKRTKFKMC